MNVKKMNDIFGYAYYLFGILYGLLIFIMIIQIFSSIGGSINSKSFAINDYGVFAKILGLMNFVLFIGSIVGIVLNLKEQSEVVIGYLLGLGAIIIGLIVPSFILVFFVFAQCGLYIKAGSMISSKNNGVGKNYRKSKQNRKNTEWFYGSDNK